MKIIKIMTVLAAALMVCSALPLLYLPAIADNSTEPAPPPPLGTVIGPKPLASDPSAQTTTGSSTTTTPPPSTQVAAAPTPQAPSFAPPAIPTSPPSGDPPPYPPGPPPTPPYPNPYPDTYPWGTWPYYWRWSHYIHPDYYYETPVIIEPTVYVPMINSFSASPNYVQPGQSTVLTWDISNDPTSVTIYPSVGSVTTSGVYTVQPGNTTTYTISATNSAGAVTASTTVTVAPPVTSYYYDTGSTTTAAPVTTVTTSDIFAENNYWWLPALLIGLLAVAAVVILILALRKPSMAAAATRANMSTSSATTPGTDWAHTTPASAGARAKFTATGGGELGLTGGFRTLGRSDFRPMLTAGKAELISRQHIQLDYQDGVYYLEDRSSTNGTRLNGEPIRGKGRHVLKDGDTIELADALTLTFRD